MANTSLDWLFEEHPLLKMIRERQESEALSMENRENPSFEIQSENGDLPNDSSFDSTCSVYWCKKCGVMMDVDYKRSNEFGVVLKCTNKNPCNHRLFFVLTDEAAFEEVTSAFNYLDAVGISADLSDGTDATGSVELDAGLLDRAEHASPLPSREADSDDDEVQHGPVCGGDMEG